MDHSEQTPNQLQQIDDDATQIPTAPAFGYTATPVLATSSVRAPVSLLPQTSESHNRARLSHHRAEHFNSLQQKLQLFWQAQKQQAERTTNFKNHCVPLARIKKIMRADEEVNMIAAETPVVFAKAIEMFIIDMTLRSWTHTEEDRRRILKPKDIASAVEETGIFDFLPDVIEKHLSKSKLTIATIPEVGSSSMACQYVPDQQYAIGPSWAIIEAGGQQSEAYMALPQLKPPLKPFIDWRQQFTQQNQEQALIPWAPQPQQQQDQETSVPLAPQPQQMQQDDDEEF